MSLRPYLISLAQAAHLNIKESWGSLEISCIEEETMGRAPCCDKTAIKKGLWTAKEDQILIDFIHKNGHENWRALPKKAETDNRPFMAAGLLRCGKSCRLRWINYLKPDIKRGNFSAEEEEAIIKLHQVFGNRWSAIASRLPGRTDNEIKNVWNTHLKKSHLRMETEPETHATAMPLTTKDAPADDTGMKFPSEAKASANSPTTISNLSDSHNPLSELFPCMSNTDSESITEDSASNSEWLHSNSIDSSVGCNQEPSTIGDGAKLDDLLIDERIILENQNTEGEETWFPVESGNSTTSEVTWEQSLSPNAHYFMYADSEDDILSGIDGEGTNPEVLWNGDVDDTTNYWLKVLSQVGTSTLF